jgi:hypothetical protein
MREILSVKIDFATSIEIAYDPLYASEVANL